MDFKELIVDIDYQNNYTKEEIIYLFNKYQICTGTKFFVPIWELSQFILKSTVHNANKYHNSYGHGQSVLNHTLRDKVESNTEKRIRISPTGRSINIYVYCAWVKRVESNNLGKHRLAIRFDLDSKTISVTKWLCEAGSFQVSRDLYTLIDKWLEDFKFKKW